MYQILINLPSNIIAIGVIWIVIRLLWQIVESKIYSEITERKMDDVIAALLAVSIFFNFN
jgi:hypothetical protein